MMISIIDLVGCPFKDHGRNRNEGFDCYGLAIEVSKRFGHKLPDLKYRKADNDTFARNAEDVISALANDIIQTESQEEGNLIVFFEGERMVHIGVILKEDTFIHADRYGVRVMRLSEYFRQNWRLYKWQH